MKKLIAIALCSLLVAIPASAQQLNISVVPVVSALAEKGHVLKGAPGLLYGAFATNLTTTAGFMVILNATAVPGDGAILPLACIPLPASGVASINYIPSPPGRYTTGITVALTSASTCFTMTSGTITGFIAGTVQ